MYYVQKLALPLLGSLGWAITIVCYFFHGG